jgi:hypothetical protein
MPAAFAEAIPFGESSIATQLAGAARRRRAAARYTSGAGLPLASSAAEQRTSIPSRPSRSQTASMSRRGEEEAMARLSPSRVQSATASATPGIG